MKREMKFLVFFPVLVLAAGAFAAAPSSMQGFRDSERAYLGAAGHPDPASVSVGPAGDVAPIVSADGWTVLTWNVPGYPPPADLQAVTDGELQASKSPRLKAAEKALISFLRSEGAVAADAVSATPVQIDAMYDRWEATLNDSQLEKKSTKYTRLLEKVERAGGTEAGARWHE